MNKKLCSEIVVVMLLTVGRSVANNLAVIHWLGYPPVRPFGYYQFTECLRGIYLSGLVLFIIWLKKEPWTEIGLSTPSWIKDFIIALFLIFTTMLIWVPVAWVSEKFLLFTLQKPPVPFVGPTNAGDLLWIFATAVIVGLGEELLIRGYLLSRLLRICGPVLSVIFSSVIFSAWHISQGIFSVAHTFIWGLVYGWTFTKVRRLYPLALAHAINDVIAFLWT